MPRILLHVCCGPCSLMPIVRLRDEGFEPVAFFFNPNIHPADEWRRRRDAMREVSEKLSVPLFEEGIAQNPGHWVRGLCGITKEGRRCALCYRVRMERAAALAAEKGIACFTTSLLYSRYQHHESIIQESKRAASLAGTAFMYRDFRPWWQEGILLSRELGIYRQKWCGCILSMKEALLQKKEAQAQKAAQKAKNAARLAKEQEERRQRREDFAQKKAKKRALRKQQRQG